MPTSPEEKTHPVDLLIIGGGINGAGIARDAQGRGLSVHLVEQNDFASATSSASSKLIHGGLRYLEYYEIRLVTEALKERDVLLQIAPHLVSPMRFILPHRPHLRPAWMIRTGLFLYDFLAGRSVLKKSKQIRLGKDAPTQPHLKKGFIYSDCWVDDARLVIHNLLDAKQLGATVENYTKCTSAKFMDGLWHAHVESNRPPGLNSIKPTPQQKIIKAKVLINATGPWAQTFIEQTLKTKATKRVRHIKGSHIIVPRQFHNQESYILQNQDKRIVFVIPYLEDLTLIGTTDHEYQGDLQHIQIDQEEMDYLLDVYNQHFKDPLTPADIVSHYSGVRPLCDDESADPSAITRDYTLEFDPGNTKQELGPILNIYGGKLTTYRKLAEASLEKLHDVLPQMNSAWTSKISLPGGNMSPDALVVKLTEQYPFLPKTVIKRWSISYGTLAFKLLQDIDQLEGLGEHFGQGLYAKELMYLREHEWAIHLEDVMARRSKLGLLMSQAEQYAVAEYLETLA